MVLVLCRAAMVEGKPHPDPIVETSSLASIKPPVPSYKHHLPVSQICRVLDCQRCCFFSPPDALVPDTPVHLDRRKL